jgi:adenylate cyclase
MGGARMTATGSACAACGNKLPPSSKFCNECGAAVAARAEAAEYKQVTVLFADVVHSMNIATTVGAERLREIMTELVNRSSAVVRRYGGTVDKFTGDGIMAVFGAPIALEDHAARACLAALGIQDEARRLAVEVEHRDSVALQLRVGLNSGEVIAGEIGSGPFGYTAIGEQVGMAQRMESVASPGGVMLSESTARLVHERAALGEPETVRIKGSDAEVPARRLLGTHTKPRGLAPSDTTLVGRTWEMNAITAILDRSINGGGAVVGLVGPPGIGKSRLAREAAAIAQSRDVEVLSTYCESHTREIPFHVVARLLRAVFGISALSPDAARSHVRSQIPHADPEDLLLLDDLLGIRDTAAPLPDISPDARHRRLTALVNTASVERRYPAVFVIEDVHWIDDVSESMLLEFTAVVPQTRSMVVVTYRPEYQGPLSRQSGSHVIELAPLDDSLITELIGDQLGTDPSVAGVTDLVTERASGNPFFAGEIVRDLAERGVLRGERGAYRCDQDVIDVTVPATLQATIGARIDRLNPDAKRTLHVAAVIGARFDAALLTTLFDEAEVQPLIEAELVDPVMFTPHAEYAFHHPLIQKVAYESQLRSARSNSHRRLAAAIEQRDPASAEENAALIATQWEAAGDFRTAFRWHMRAGTWFNFRDVRAARMSWQRARQVADQLRPEETDRAAMRIAPRTLLCGTTFRVGGGPADTGFDELRELATAAHDNVSLAIGMAGHLTTLAFNGHYRDALQMAAELEALVESIGDSTLIVALLYSAAQAQFETGGAAECVRLAQRVIDLAAADPTEGNVMLASPLAWALAVRGAAKLALGRPDWIVDVDEGIAMAEPFDATARVVPGLYRYACGITNGALMPDESAESHTAGLLKVSEMSGDESAVALARLNRGVVLLHLHDPQHGTAVDMLGQAREALARQRISGGLRRIADVEMALAKAMAGDVDGAIELARAVLDEQFAIGDMISRGPAATVLVESLLRRGADTDLEEAQAATDRLAAVPTEPGFVLHEIHLLRLRALLARECGDEPSYQQLGEHYRSTVKTLGFERHIAIAEAMT